MLIVVRYDGGRPWRLGLTKAGEGSEDGMIGSRWKTTQRNVS